MLKSGRVLEDAFLRQASRDYPELNPSPASLEMDMHHGTDVVLNRDGRVIPLGLTRKMEVEKVLRDKSKASRMWDMWVEVIIPDGDEDDLAIDNALSFLSNDLKEETGFFVLTASSAGVHSARLQ